MFRVLHAFHPKRLEELCMEKLGEKERLLLPESVKYCTLKSSLSRDIPYLEHDANLTACLIFGARQKGWSYEIEDEDEFWEIFSLFLKHKGYVLAQHWI